MLLWIWRGFWNRGRIRGRTVPKHPAGRSFYIEKAYEKLTEISADDLKRLEYEARGKAIRDHNYLMNYNKENSPRCRAV
ncbi:MAG: hypothetical protein HFI20_08660 [Lachnospiraceae bacterium]|nr:hypothetical protein [Lachnospiraceae bacterium]